ncbi:hypothetical protein CIB84_002362 [Bambusicola thoracicus]|uniref:Major facilitator superfamily (MFS) profile domain-containing protein n=1 Tax=Bambusicola thoracicus TaxID=9083 RepID=A0A2P4TBZ9_BAMTH|nr:hypothetical protein CIB84_002362 [Bambusicola thoracicus]
MTGFLSDLVQYQGLFRMVIVLGIGGTFQIGFQISTITYMNQHVKAFINETWLERYGYPIHQDNLLFLWSLIVSILGIGGLLGASGSRYLTVKYGKELLGSQSRWPMLMASCGIPALVQLFTLPFFPESPPYLLMHKEDQEGCKKAIRQLWGEGHHQAEIDDIMKEKATMKNIKILSVLELMKEPATRWQLYMIIILTVSVQLCGINAVECILPLTSQNIYSNLKEDIVALRSSSHFSQIYFYTFEVLQAAGFEERMVYYMTLSIGLAELLATVVCSSIIERLGRKTLIRGGYCIMGSLLAAITVTLSLQDWYFWMPYCSLCLIILFVVVFGLGPGGATVSMRVEIFKLSCRAPAFVISSVFNWLGVFVIGTTFPFIVVSVSKQKESALSPKMATFFSDLHIRKFINETWIERHGSPLHPETIMLLWSFIVSVFGIGGLLGSLCCGYLTTRYRKKKCQIVTNLIMLVAALLMAFSKTAKSFEMILAGRFLYGVGTGFSLNIHPQYVGEISPKKLRGFTNSTVSVFLTLGKLTGQVVGLREILGSEALWPWLLASSGLSALLQLVTLPFFPDSPSYLLIQKGNEEAFRKAIRKLWGEGDHQAEIDDIMKEKVAMTSTKTLRVLELIKEPSMRWQLYILMTVMTTLQLCGINAIYFYCFEVFHTAKFEEYLIPYVSLGVGLCECLSSILCHQFFWLHYFSVILIFLFVVFYGIGPSGASITIMVEIFSQSFRPSAFLIVGCINWMGLFVLGMIFPLIVDNLGPFCFLIFLGILALSATFIYLYLPETKGKSIMEIKAEFNKLNFGKKEISVTENNFPKDQLFCTKL